MTRSGASYRAFYSQFTGLFAFIFIAGFILFTTSDASAQNRLQWTRGGGNIPYNAVAGGRESNGAILYICRTTHSGTTVPGKVVGGKCNYNWGTTEYASSNFDVLTGGGEYWTRDINTRTAVAGGSGSSQVYYVCRAYASGGTHPGRLQDGKCNYGYGGRGYASTNYEVLNSDRPVGGATAAVSLLDAALRGDASQIRAALKAGEAINQKNDKGQTALILAASKGSTDAVRVLLNEGATVDARDNEGFTALMYAAYAGSPQSVRQLIRAGANLNARTNNGDTAFYYAAASGNIETAQTFLDDPAFDGLESAAAGYPLHAAAAYGHPQMIEFLLDEEVLDINEQDLNGNTPLMRAAAQNRANAVSTLIRNGADVTLRENNNYDVVGIAAYNDAADALAALLQSGKFEIRSPAITNAFLISADSNKQNVLKYLLRSGINVNAVDDRSGNTALIYAAARGNKDVTKLLLDSRPDVNHQNTRGETALMLAAAKSETDILKMLLKSGADINLQDESGRTALRHAIDNNHKDTRKALEKAGAQQ